MRLYEKKKTYQDFIFKKQKENNWFGFSFNYILFNYISLSLILHAWISSLLEKLGLSLQISIFLGKNAFLSFKKSDAESEEVLKLGYNQLSFNFYYQSLPDITFGISDWFNVWLILKWSFVHLCIDNALSNITGRVFSWVKTENSAFCSVIYIFISHCHLQKHKGPWLLKEFHFTDEKDEWNLEKHSLVLDIQLPEGFIIDREELYFEWHKPWLYRHAIPVF